AFSYGDWVMAKDGDITGGLTDAHGSAGATPVELLPLVYEQLKSLARQRMFGENDGHTLQATALVHEAYLRLVEAEGIKWSGRAHFFLAAAEAMRRILIDHARS